MSKNSRRKKKPEAAGTTRVTGSVQVARPSKNATVGANKKKENSQSEKKSSFPSKSDRVLSLLKQASGATLDELMKATKWQAHSVRGFLSGAVKKRKGLTVVSECDGDGTRRYRIDAGPEA